MNSLARTFYRIGNDAFHAVLLLSETQDGWEDCVEKCADLPRGWYELSRLAVEDRIAFVREFWSDRLPFHPSFHFDLDEFFDKVDDLDVVLCKMKESSPWTAEMVYSLKENRSFFRGLPPVGDEEAEELKRAAGVSLPRDYLSFLRIHNGFGRLSELGLLSAGQVVTEKRELEAQLVEKEQPLQFLGHSVDPSGLIPFYESFGLASYQCFFAEWYPTSEMGNVYLSGIDYTISDCTDRDEWADQLAFATFLEWLAFYLEGNSLEME